jgi:hypothetical protein
MMKSSRALWILFVLVVGLAPLAFSQDVTLTLVNGGQYSMDGIYVGAYNATLNNTPANIICDDFEDEVYQNESWTASVTQANTITNSTTGLKWSTGGDLAYWGVSNSNIQLGYDAMLYLAQQVLPISLQNGQNAQTIGYYSYAIWAIFDPSAVYSYLKQNDSNFVYTWGQVEALVQTALGKTYTPNEFAGWEVLTPQCGGGSSVCNDGPPQEFLIFVPEGGSALMYLLLAGVSCIGAFLFRSRSPRTQRESL